MKLLVAFLLCSLLVSASKRFISSDSFSKLMDMSRKGDSRGVEEILSSPEKPSKEALLESFRIALKAGNIQICRVIASKLPKKYVLRELLKSKDFRSAKEILGENSGTKLTGLDEMFVDHCLKYCPWGEGVHEELKLLLKLPTLNTNMISKTLIGLLDFDMYNIDLMRVLLADERFEGLILCPFFFNFTMDIMRAVAEQGNCQYDMFLCEMMGSKVWQKITDGWSVDEHTYFLKKLCRYGAIHSMKHYLENNNVDQRQLSLCISESLGTPLAASPFLLSTLLSGPESKSQDFLQSIQTIILSKKRTLGCNSILLENYMVLVSFLFRFMSQLVKSDDLKALYQEVKDYLLVTRIKYLQVPGMGCIPSDVLRLIALTYLSISGFE